MSLFLFLFAAQGLTLKSGEILVCDTFLLAGNRLIVQLKGTSYSIRENQVDWTIPVQEIEAPVNHDFQTLPFYSEELPTPLPYDLDFMIEKLEVKNASLIDVLRLLADQIGFNLYIDSSVRDEPITFSFRQIRWQDAVAVLLGSQNLQFEFLTREKTLQIF